MAKFTVEEQNSERGTRIVHHLYDAKLDDAIEFCMKLTGEFSLARVRSIESYLNCRHGTDPSYTYSVGKVSLRVARELTF